MTTSEARRILRRCDKGLIAYVYGRGHRWVQSTFLPALQRLARKPTREDRPLVAHGFYLLGDVHDFNRAPNAAIRAYRKALSIAPAIGAAWREIGSMYMWMGQWSKARDALRRAAKWDPEDYTIRTDLDFCTSSSRKALYKPGDRIWDSAEFLASGKLPAALEALEGLRTVRARQARARVYAVRGDGNRALEEWKGIARSRGKVELEPIEWFFLADLFWNRKDFWRLIWKLRGRIPEGIAGTQRGLHKLIPITLGPRTKSAAIRRTAKRSRLFLEYHLARLSHDGRKASTLARRYPRWPEIQKLARKLSKKDKMRRV